MMQDLLVTSAAAAIEGMVTLGSTRGDSAEAAAVACTAAFSLPAASNFALPARAVLADGMLCELAQCGL